VGLHAGDYDSRSPALPDTVDEFLMVGAPKQVFSKISRRKSGCASARSPRRSAPAVLGEQLGHAAERRDRQQRFGAADQLFVAGHVRRQPALDVD